MRQVTPAIGVEVFDLDVRDPDCVTDVIALLEAHRVCVLRDQWLTLEDFEKLAGLFGPLFPAPWIRPIDGHPNLVRVLKEAHDDSAFVFGGGWHSDVSYIKNPPRFTMLLAEDVPPVGGDTLFANTACAFQALTPAMREMLRPLRAIHTAAPSYGRNGVYAKKHLSVKSMEISCSVEAEAEVSHPLVQKNSKGQEYLFLSPTTVSGLEGFKPQESRPLIRFLNDHCVQRVFSCQIRWEPNTLIIWDNRGVLHSAINDYHNYRRSLLRAMVGEAKC